MRVQPHEAVSWSAFAVLILVYLGLPALFGYALPVRLLLVVIYLSIAAMAVLAVRRTARVAVGVERRAWDHLLAAVVLLALGDLMWSIGQVAGSDAGDWAYALSFVLYALACVPLIMYVGTVLSAGLSGAPVLTKMRYSLDLAIALLFIGAFTLVFALLPALRLTPASERSVWAMHSFFNLVGVFAFVALFAAMLESRERVWLRWEAKIVAALGLLFLADLLTDALIAVDAFTLGSTATAAADGIWMFAYFMLAMAAVQRRRMGTAVSALATMAPARRGRLRWYDFGIAAGLLSVVPYVLYQVRYGQLGDLEYWLLAVSSFAIALLVIARSMVLTSENGNLLFHTVVDPLTGAYNHRFFQERVSNEVERARRSGEPLSVALLDIDGFGAVNERFGHLRGDQCLVRIAELLRIHERASDTVCRMGGDEFAIIMPSTSPEDAAQRVRDIQQTVALDRGLSDCIETISAGIAGCPDHANERITLVAKADGALYWAKAERSGTVLVYDDEVVQALTPEERLLLAEEQSYMATVESLAAAVDARDHYTQHHSRNVSVLAGKLAAHLRLSDNQIRLIEIAGLLHDVGKIGVPDTILRKAGALSEDERSKIEEHPDLGQRILSATIFKEILPWVLSHHERWDGTGYPQRLDTDAIPLEARILAVCDAFDAMTSDRPYRSGMAEAIALAEIERNAGSQFDPVVAAAFVHMCTVEGELRLVAERVTPGRFDVAAEPAEA